MISVPRARRVRGIGTDGTTTGRHGLRTGAGGERYFWAFETRNVRASHQWGGDGNVYADLSAGLGCLRNRSYGGYPLPGDQLTGQGAAARRAASAGERPAPGHPGAP